MRICSGLDWPSSFSGWPVMAKKDNYLINRLCTNTSAYLCFKANMKFASGQVFA